MAWCLWGATAWAEWGPAEGGETTGESDRDWDCERVCELTAGGPPSTVLSTSLAGGFTPVPGDCEGNSSADAYAEAEDETVDATEKAGETERVFERVLWAGGSTSISMI